MLQQSKKIVVVTGITGFLGSHIAIQLIEQGYNVRGTLRSLKRASHIESIILSHVAKSNETITNETITNGTISFVECDLLKDEGWQEAMAGADYLIHTASPFLPYVPKDENELVKPAVEGTLRVLKAAHANKITRVVLTSSIAAVLYGQHTTEQTEHNWTEPSNKRVTPYYKSKTLAEQAAWQFAKESGLSLSVINPGLILGPILEADYGTSAELIVKLMDRSFPGLPHIGFSVVDVRDVANAHILAMLTPEAEGERFIIAGKFMWISEIAKVLSNEYPQFKIPTRGLPNWLVKSISYIDPAVKTIIKDLGFQHNLSNKKAKHLLNWTPRVEQKSIIDTANTLIEQGIL